MAMDIYDECTIDYDDSGFDPDLDETLVSVPYKPSTPRVSLLLYLSYYGIHFSFSLLIFWRKKWINWPLILQASWIYLLRLAKLCWACFDGIKMSFVQSLFIFIFYFEFIKLLSEFMKMDQLKPSSKSKTFIFLLTTWS